MRRARSRRSDSGPVLPEDLVVWEILVRLPAKPLLRCRAVCRSWLRRTSEPGFLLAHHRRQPSLPLVVFQGELPSQHSHTVVVNASLDTLDLRRRGSPSEAERQPVLRFNDYKHHHGFSVHASCDGLLLLSLSDKDLYLCNPATRQWTPFPHLTGANGAMLYPHASSGEYRVIYWKGRTTRNVPRKVVYHVITLSSLSKPRRVEVEASTTPCVKRLVETGWCHFHDRPGVLLHGCLHWLLHGSTEKFLLVFDTCAESFRSMPSPVVADYMMPQLLVMNNDTLAISWIHESQTMMKLWVLQDYETGGVWSLKRRVIFPLVEMRSILNDDPCRFYGTVVSAEGDVLLHHPGSFHLFHSDCKGDLVHKLCWNNVFPRPAGHWFRESLVRHDFFGRQYRTRAMRQPRFFRGL